MERKTIERAEWYEFQQAGLLWFINRMLHVFGWAIVFEIDDENHSNVLDVYPARVKFRGFENEGDNFVKLTNHMNEEMSRLLEDIEG